MINLFDQQMLLWTGDVDDLVNVNMELPEWQLDMIRALDNLPVGAAAFVGIEEVFKVVRV
jgi:hypothetical protein